MLSSTIGIAALTVLLLMHLVFVYALRIKNNSIVDVWWGLGFALIAVISLCASGLYLPRQLIITAMTLMWATRISLHIYLRNRGKGEDPRYTKWRTQWGKNVVWRSYLQVFMLQGLFMLIIAMPIIVVNASTVGTITKLVGIGCMVWLLGICMEALADYQLKRFLQDPAHRGHIMQEGLWRYSRHPNYVGEMLIWWGMFLVAADLPHGMLALMSPIVITILLRFVSGVPLAEEQLKQLPEFGDYARRTNIFLPWFRR
jgi:steroid 5-alpha reductase family enzyme